MMSTPPTPSSPAPPFADEPPSLDGAHRVHARPADGEPTPTLLFEALSNATVYVFDLPTRHIEWISHDVRTSLGFAPHELHQLKPLDFLSIVHPEDLPHLLERFAQWSPLPHPSAPAFRGEAVIQTECRLRHRDNSWRPFVLRESVLARTADSGIQSIIGMAFDAHAQRASADERLRTAKLDALSRLAGGIAHDFNNLLTVLLGNIALARAVPSTPPEVLSHLDTMHDVAEQATTIARQILAFARQQPPNLVPTDLNHHLRECTPNLERALAPQRLTLALSPLLPVAIDRPQLSEVFLNLVANARDAGGDLTVTTTLISDAAEVPDATPSPPKVRVTLTDTGTGIPAAALDHIFDPFFSTKAPGRGNGLGLATAHGVMTRHGGSIAIHSAPGAGTTVTLLFPTTTPAPNTRSALKRPLPTAAPAAILVAEDDLLVAELVRRILTRAGYTVHLVPDGQAALDFLGQSPEPIALVLSDIVMPRLSGLDLARQLKTTHPALPLLLMSGYPADNRPGGDNLLKHSAFIAKPFHAPELTAKIASLLAAARTDTTDTAR